MNKLRRYKITEVDRYIHYLPSVDFLVSVYINDANTGKTDVYAYSVKSSKFKDTSGKVKDLPHYIRAETIVWLQGYSPDAVRLWGLDSDGQKFFYERNYYYKGLFHSAITNQENALANMLEGK